MRQPLAALAGALILYTWTLAPGVVWGDSAELATSVRLGALPFGTPDSHPLHTVLAWAFARLPGELAWDVNLLSAVFAALTVMLVFLIAARLARTPRAGWFAAAALGVSHAFWLHAVIAEVYAVNAFFVAALVWAAIRWRDASRSAGGLLAIALLAGVGATNHVALVTTVPALVYFAIASDPRHRWRVPGALAAGAAACVAAYATSAFVRQRVDLFWYGPPGITEYFMLQTDWRRWASEAAFYVLYLAYQFPIVATAAGVLGVRALGATDRTARNLLLLCMAVNGLFFVKTTLWGSYGSTKYVFYIPDYVVFAIFAGVGADRLASRLARRAAGPPIAWLPAGALVGAALVAAPLVLYNAAPVVLPLLGVDVLHARPLPYRDNNAFFLNPSKRHDTGALRFGEEALNSVAPRAVIVADHSLYTVLEYLQICDGVRPDVLLVRSVHGNRVRSVAELAAEVRRRHHDFRPDQLYLAALTPGYYDRAGLRRLGAMTRFGPIFAVSSRRPSEADQRGRTSTLLTRSHT